MEIRHKLRPVVPQRFEQVLVWPTGLVDVYEWLLAGFPNTVGVAITGNDPFYCFQKVSRGLPLHRRQIVPYGLERCVSTVTSLSSGPNTLGLRNNIYYCAPQLASIIAPESQRSLTLQQVQRGRRSLKH